MTNITPREEEMNKPPADEPIPDYFDPEKEIELLSVEEHSDLIEHEILHALLEITRNADRPNDRRAAASDLAEIIGKKGKAIQVFSGKNVQVNQIEANPDLKRHLIESAQGLKALTEATDSHVISKQGGSGV